MIVFSLELYVCKEVVKSLILNLLCFQVYKNEFEKYDQTRKRLEVFAIQIMSTGPTAPYSQQVQKRCRTINHRWEVLCREVGVSFRKAEETLFNLRLLEAVLTRLNEWLKTVENRVIQLSAELQESDKSRQKLLDLEVIAGFCRISPFVFIAASLHVLIKEIDMPVFRYFRTTVLIDTACHC